MAIPVNLAFRNVEPAQLLERLVREQAERLERSRKGAVAGCRVLIERRRNRRAGSTLMHVRVDLEVGEAKPLDVDVIDRDAYLASIEAFRLAGIRLDEHARRSQTATARHAETRGVM